MSTEPCTSACPAGDCAGCVFPPRLVRCLPRTACPQADRCAHADVDRCDPSQAAVDGTVLHHSLGAWCPLFVDRRGAMLEAA